MTQGTEKEICELIKAAIGDEAQEITIESSMEAVTAWDSLSHLSILVALDTRFDGKVAAIKEMAKANSVMRIVQILRENRLI